MMMITGIRIILKYQKNILNKFPDILIANKIYFDDGKYKIFKKINKINLSECFMKNPGILGSNIIIKKKLYINLMDLIKI